MRQDPLRTAEVRTEEGDTPQESPKSIAASERPTVRAWGRGLPRNFPDNTGAAEKTASPAWETGRYPSQAQEEIPTRGGFSPQRHVHGEREGSEASGGGRPVSIALAGGGSRAPGPLGQQDFSQTARTLPGAPSLQGTSAQVRGLAGGALHLLLGSWCPPGLTCSWSMTPDTGELSPTVAWRSPSVFCCDSFLALSVAPLSLVH